MITEDTRCSDASVLVSEPLAGTAATAWRWLFLEVREPWSRKGFPDCELPKRVIARLLRLGRDHAGVRVGFIRRPDRCEGPLSFFFADTRPEHARVHAFELAEHAALLDLDLDALILGEPGDGAGAELPERYTDPLYMVCTHGLRDICCARLGPPVYRAIEARAPGDAWQATHIGGHRFAATLLALPSGLCYGRVTPPEAGAIAAAHHLGRIYTDLDRLRGRTCWAPHVQAAEIALRRETGDRAPGSVALLREAEVGPDGWEVTLAHAGVERAYALTRAPLEDAAPPSCGKPLKTPAAFTATPLEAPR